MNRTLIYQIALGCVIFLTSCGKQVEETTPIRKDVTETIFAAGVLEARNTYNLTAQADGYLVQLNFEEGDLVKINDVLAVVENQEAGLNKESADALYQIAMSNTRSSAPALQQAQNNISKSKQKMDLVFDNYFRHQKLWERNSIAKKELDESELEYVNAKAEYENAIENYKLLQQQAEQQLINNDVAKSINAVVAGRNKIKAVFNGKVYRKFKSPGDFIKRGEAIAQIGVSDSIYALVNIDESNISKVRVGQPAHVKLNTDKEKLYLATVSEIYPSFDEATQSFICKLRFNDSLTFDIVNTQLQSNIVVGVNKNALLIPRHYIDFGGNVQLKNKKEKVKVVTKFISNDWVQVLSGIDEHSILVTDDLPVNKTATSEAGAQMQQ